MSSAQRKIVLGTFIGGLAGISLILLMGLLSFFVDCTEWRTKSFLQILTLLGSQELFAFLYYGIIVIPLSVITGILMLSSEVQLACRTYSCGGDRHL